VRQLFLMSLGLMLTASSAVAADKKVDELLKECNEFAQKGKLDEALKSADEAAKLDPKDARVFLARGKIHETLDNHKEAVADFSMVIELDAKNADAFSHRGSEHFRSGKLKESIEDFDRSFELKPNPEEQWKRGIAHYYAGHYEAGQKDFEAGKKVWSHDVENAAWWYVCAVKVEGADKAQANILKIDDDKRVPLMAVYDLYKGKAKPEDVLKAAGRQADRVRA
jgi:tetratricopeptide (TPR) repeat protein